MSNPEFGEIVREVLAGESARKASLRCEVSHTHIADMAAGRVPMRKTLIRFADGLELSGDIRSRLFYAAGYLDPQDTPAEAATVAA